MHIQPISGFTLKNIYSSSQPGFSRKVSRRGVHKPSSGKLPFKNIIPTFVVLSIFAGYSTGVDMMKSAVRLAVKSVPADLINLGVEAGSLLTVVGAGAIALRKKK